MKSTTACLTSARRFSNSCRGFTVRSRIHSIAVWPRGCSLPAFMKIGTWIGGDRDGNPHVNDEVLRYALERQSAVAMDYYLTEVQRLRRELSQSLRVVQVTAEIEQLARRSADQSAHRRDEPYRLVLSHVHDRLVATASTLVPGAACRPERNIVSPLTRIQSEFAGDLKNSRRFPRTAWLGPCCAGPFARLATRRVELSAFIWRRWTCGSIARSTDGLSPSCSAPARAAKVTINWLNPSVSAGLSKSSRCPVCCVRRTSPTAARPNRSLRSSIRPRCCNAAMARTPCRRRSCR